MKEMARSGCKHGHLWKELWLWFLVGREQKKEKQFALSRVRCRPEFGPKPDPTATSVLFFCCRQCWPLPSRFQPGTRQGTPSTQPIKNFSFPLRSFPPLLAQTRNLIYGAAFVLVQAHLFGWPFGYCDSFTPGGARPATFLSDARCDRGSIFFGRNVF